MQETSIDLRFNIAALCVAILRDDIATPEQAFAVLEEERYRPTDEDTLDMVAMHSKGIPYRDIGEIYGISWSTAAKRIQRHKRRISQTAI